MQILGASVEAIAGEKAGILKPGVPLITFADGAAYPVIHTIAKKCSAPVRTISRQDVRYGVGQNPRVSVTVNGCEISAACPLSGHFQMENLALALAAFHYLTGAAGDMTERLAGLHWPGRMETLKTKPSIILDGAHNMSGVEEFLHSVEELDGRDLLVFGCMKDKEAAPMYRLLKSRFQRICLTSGEYHRFMGPDDFAEHPDFSDPYVSLENLSARIRESNRTFVCGSLHLVGDVIRTLSAESDFREVLLETKPYCYLLDSSPF